MPACVVAFALPAVDHQREMWRVTRSQSPSNYGFKGAPPAWCGRGKHASQEGGLFLQVGQPACLGTRTRLCSRITGARERKKVGAYVQHAKLPARKETLGVWCVLWHGAGSRTQPGKELSGSCLFRRSTVDAKLAYVPTSAGLKGGHFSVDSVGSL